MSQTKLQQTLRCLRLFMLAGLSALAGALHAEPKQPDIVMILIDSLRADHLGCYGYSRDTSPVIDAFAKRSVRFNEVIASGAWTQPSIMTLFTSVSPDTHLRVHPSKPHAENVITLAQALQKAGYQTVAVTANGMTQRKFGYARGFEHYDDYTTRLAVEAAGDNSPKTSTTRIINRMAEEWLENKRDPERPIFLFLLYMDVHWDYFPPPPYNSMFTDDPIPPPRGIWSYSKKNVQPEVQNRIVAAYDGEIRFTDTLLDDLLKQIESSARGDNTVIAFCSDHGEAFWEHGVLAHGNNLYDEELRVPLIIRPPVIADATKPSGAVVNGQVGLIDVAPTLLDLAGVGIPPEWQGRSLRPYLAGGEMPGHPLILDTRYDGLIRGVRTSQFKLVARHPFDAPQEVYDLKADPGEKNNLVATGEPLPDEVTKLIPLLKPADFTP